MAAVAESRDDEYLTLADILRVIKESGLTSFKYHNQGTVIEGTFGPVPEPDEKIPAQPRKLSEEEILLYSSQ